MGLTHSIAVRTGKACGVATWSRKSLIKHTHAYREQSIEDCQAKLRTSQRQQQRQKPAENKQYEIKRI
uniref:Uncharacterized protein n=1 Tax=Anguilla anguilla TaxID=7936 RepID=A0A0E9XF64_ANGAN